MHYKYPLPLFPSMVSHFPLMHMVVIISNMLLKKVGILLCVPVVTISDIIGTVYRWLPGAQ